MWNIIINYNSKCTYPSSGGRLLFSATPSVAPRHKDPRTSVKYYLLSTRLPLPNVLCLLLLTFILQKKLIRRVIIFTRIFNDVYMNLRRSNTLPSPFLHLFFLGLDIQYHYFIWLPQAPNSGRVNLENDVSENAIRTFVSCS